MRAIAPGRRLLPLLSLVVLACLAAPVQAQTDVPWTDQPRRLELQSDDGGFRFTSVRPGHEEVLAGVFVLSRGAFEWSYQGNASAEPLRSRVLVRAILEWQDADGNTRLTPGERIVQRHSLAQFPNATLEVLPHPAGGRVAHATYALEGSQSGPLDPLTGRRIVTGTSLTLSFYLFESVTRLPGLTPGSADIPMEIRIQGWSARNGTHLGLELDLQSVGPMQVQQDSWRALHEHVEHELSWSSTHTSNGTPRATHVGGLVRPGPVGLANIDAQTTLLVAYQPGDILHSLSFGTQPRTQILTDVPSVVAQLVGEGRLYAAGAAAAALAIGASAARKMRQP